MDTIKDIYKLNRIMMRSKTEQEYLEKICKIVIEDCGYKMVWIGFVQNDENKSVKSVAQAGFDDGSLKTSISLPLIDDGTIFGALNIHSTEIDAFTDDEIKLLSELAADLSYGISYFRLQKAKEKAEKALLELERAKRLSDIGTLATTVAHELRNPLAAINISSAIIKRKTDDKVIKHHLSNIEKSIAESDQIINNLLFYSRLKAPHLETVFIPKIIDECIKTAHTQSGKKIILTRSFDISDESLIEADPLQMKEIFSNILNNAFDAIPNGVGEINVSVIDDSDNIEIGIKDNGSGIEEENLKRVFDPFFSTKAKGTGLGLSVCQNIINLHNGYIRINSEINKGTTVDISLPKKIHKKEKMTNV